MPESNEIDSTVVLSPLAQHLTAAIAGVTELERQLVAETSRRNQAEDRAIRLDNQIDELTQTTVEQKSRIDAYTFEIDRLNKAVREYAEGQLRQADLIQELRAEIERLKAAAGSEQQPAPTPQPQPQPVPQPQPQPTPEKPPGAETVPASPRPSRTVVMFEATGSKLWIDTVQAPTDRWKSETRWATKGVGVAQGIRLLLDVHDSGQMRVSVERCDASLPHTAPVLIGKLVVVSDGKSVHDAPLRIHHHTRPTLVFNRRQPDKSKALSVATMAKSALLPALPYHQIDVPETELARIASGGGNWPRWPNAQPKDSATVLTYDRVSEEYGQCVRDWTGGAGPLLNEAGMLMPVQCAYLLSRDERAWREVIRLADSSGNYAVHYRLPDGRFPRADETADLPFLQRDVQFTLMTAAGVRLPVPDVAHQHSLVYLAYLLTGERYYYEELQAWWTFNLLTRPKNADRLQGIVFSGQLRATAWALRSLLHLVLTSDTEPEKTHYQLLLVRNLQWMTQQFTRLDSPHYRPTGLCHIDPWRSSAMLQYVRAEPKPQWTATWMHYVLAFVLHECVRAGYDEAVPMRDHLLKVAEACWRYAPSKYLAPWGNHAVPGHVTLWPNEDEQWKEMMAATFAGMPTADPHRAAFVDPITPDYIAWFRAACVVGVDAGQGRAWAKEALAWIDAEVPKSRWKAIPYEWRVQPGTQP